MTAEKMKDVHTLITKLGLKNPFYTQIQSLIPFSKKNSPTAQLLDDNMEDDDKNNVSIFNADIF